MSVRFLRIQRTQNPSSIRQRRRRPKKGSLASTNTAARHTNERFTNIRNNKLIRRRADDSSGCVCLFVCAYICAVANVSTYCAACMLEDPPSVSHPIPARCVPFQSHIRYVCVCVRSVNLYVLWRKYHRCHSEPPTPTTDIRLSFSSADVRYIRDGRMCYVGYPSAR